MKRMAAILLAAVFVLSVFTGCQGTEPGGEISGDLYGPSGASPSGGESGQTGGDPDASGLASTAESGMATNSEINNHPGQGTTNGKGSQNTSNGGGVTQATSVGGNTGGGKIVEASFTRNADGTCTDKENGIVFLHDELNNKDLMFEYGSGINLDSNNPQIFDNDISRVTRNANTKPTDNWFTYKLDAGITEVSIVMFVYETCDPKATITVQVSPDNKTWKKVTLQKSARTEMTYTWAMYTVSAKNIDKSNKYLKIDLGAAPDPHWNINISRLRINNTAKMDDIDRFLEIRESATFYVDSKMGSDNNDGLSESKPFKSLSKVSSRFFQEGDKILFKRGRTYNGTVTIRGYGTASNPITVGTYGSGDLPKIVARGSTAAVNLQANHIKLEGLDVSNVSGSFGIYITPLQTGVNPGITVSGCRVHDVNTSEKTFGYINGGGIIAVADGKEPTWFEGLSIQNNTITNVCRCAVVITSPWGWRYTGDGDYIRNEFKSDSEGWWPSKNCQITGNTIDSTRGDSILIQCGKDMLIERNTVYNACSSKDSTRGAMVAIWTICTVDTVMQYNEVGYTKRITADGEAFDTDHAEVNCKIQYNYSHNNEGGFVLLCNGMSGTAKNATVRYNLSVNDGAKCAVINLIGDVPGTQVYNNTFYLGNQVKSVMSMWGNDGKPTKATGITLTNNIFSAPTAGTGNYWSGGSVGTDFYNAVTNIKFNNNLFHNVNQPQQKGGVTLSGNVSGNPNFALSTDYKNKANMIKGFTPRNKVSGAVDVANNGGKDINGNAAASKIFGCVNY